MSKTTWLVFTITLGVSLAGCSHAPAGSSYRVYVSNEGSGDLTVIDPVKMEALATLRSGSAPGGSIPARMAS